MRLNRNSMTIRMLQIASNICNEDGVFNLIELLEEFYEIFPDYKNLFKTPVSNRIYYMSYGPKSYLQRIKYNVYRIKNHTADYLINNDLLSFKEPFII